MILGRARLLHEKIRQRDHLAPNAIGQHLAYQLQILLRQTLLAMLFQRDPHLVETIKFSLVEAICLARHAQYFPALRIETYFFLILRYLSVR